MTDSKRSLLGSGVRIGDSGSAPVRSTLGGVAGLSGMLMGTLGGLAGIVCVDVSMMYFAAAW